jgi:uncharacterized membrane protein YkoI
MTSRKAISSALLPALTVSAMVVATPFGVRGAIVHSEGSVETTSKADLQNFKQATVSLGQAISITESTKGGTVIEANFQIKNRRPVYEVKSYLPWDKSVWEGAIDAGTGRVIGKGKTIREDQLDQKDQSDLAGLHQWDVSLAEAVVAAKYSGSGTPISAGLKERGGKVFFEVTVAKNGSATNIFVDAQHGHVVS